MPAVVGMSTGDVLCSIPVGPCALRGVSTGVPLRPVTVEFVELTDEQICIPTTIGVIAADERTTLRNIGRILGVMVLGEACGMIAGSV